MSERHNMQNVFLNTPGCMEVHFIVHELMHALGFQHMHMAPDRDDYIHVDLNNVNETYFNNFEKVKSTDYSYFGTAYDLDSIMHYGKNFYALDADKPTMYIKVRTLLICILYTSAECFISLEPRR